MLIHHLTATATTHRDPVMSGLSYIINGRFFGHQNQHANNKPNKNGVLHCWTPKNRFNQTKLWHLLPFPIILQLLGPLRPGWLPTANQRFWVRIWGFASDPCSWCMDIYLILCGRFSMVVTWSKQVFLRKAECYRSTTNGCKTRAYTWIKNKIDNFATVCFIAWPFWASKG